MPEPPELVGELRAVLGRVGLAMSLLPDAMVYTDAAGRVLWCNPAFDRLVRRPHLSTLGQGVIEILPLRRAGQLVSADAHPINRVAREHGELSETYECAQRDEPLVLDVHARRGGLPENEIVVLHLRDMTDRTRAQERMQQLNVELEAANVELESFSYSVSHDLRAPLRAMDGFSQALLEDYEDRLDAEGKDYLLRIRAAAQNMGKLIDSLLQLSRVTRVELRRDSVNLSDLANAIARELRASAPGRQAEFRIQDGLNAKGDSYLLHQVLENLLDNAWKFTGKTACARIELGAVCQDGETAYFVRDNGAGFDMSHADKLFGAVQRLHTAHEFPGTGVGLATVRRIVRRHGGRTWAEGAPGKGACFYFTVPSGDLGG